MRLSLRKGRSGDELLPAYKSCFCLYAEQVRVERAVTTCTQRGVPVLEPLLVGPLRLRLTLFCVLLAAQLKRKEGTGSEKMLEYYHLSSVAQVSGFSSAYDRRECLNDVALTLDEELKSPLRALPYYEMGKSLTAGGSAGFLGNFGCVGFFGWGGFWFLKHYARVSMYYYRPSVVANVFFSLFFFFFFFFLLRRAACTAATRCICMGTWTFRRSSSWSRCKKHPATHTICAGQPSC